MDKLPLHFWLELGRRSVVAQSWTLLYRRVALCGASERANVWDRFDVLPNTIRRYSRLKICATTQPVALVVRSIAQNYRGLGVKESPIGAMPFGCGISSVIIFHVAPSSRIL